MNLEPLERRVKRLEQLLALLPIQSGTWTPTVTQSNSVAATVTYARYLRLGRWVWVWVNLAVTAAGTAGNKITIGGQPAVIQSALFAGTEVIGPALVIDAGTGAYNGVVLTVSATAWDLLNSDTSSNYIGAAPNFALANGDFINFQATYELS